MAAVTLPADVDTTRWSPAEDGRGQPLAPGDLVSFPLHPRGTARGRVELSARAWVETAAGRVAALVAVTEDGTRYPLSGGKRLRRLRK